jgi:zinc protease
MNRAIRTVSHLVACCLIAIPALLVAAQQVALPPGVEKVTAAEGITEYRLPNGLRVLLFPDNSKPTVTVNVTYLVGSRHENYGETGMAHLLEHLVFKGTPRNPKMVEQFNAHGAKWNANTSFDRTTYFETFAGTEENLKWALDVEADRMVNSNIAKSDLDTEMTVVRNEYERGENEPGQVLFKRLQSVAFDWHNYSNSPIGNRSDIENVAIENLRAFYRMYYQPDNAVLLVAGKFEEGGALAIIANTFGTIAKPARVLPKLWTVEPVQDGERTFIVRRKGEVQIVSVSYKVPGALHPDTEAFGLGNPILAGAPAGRLHKALVETGKAVAVGARGGSTLDPGLITFIAVLKKDGSIEEAQKVLIETVESFADAPPTEEEMARTRAQLTKGFDQAWSSSEAMASVMAEMTALGDWRIFFHERDGIAKITATQVADSARKYLRRDNRTVGLFIPTDAPLRAEVPPAPLAAAVLKDFKSAQVVAAGEDFDPTPANIDARTTLSKLPAGLSIALLPKKTRGGTVNVRIQLHWGDLESLRGKQAQAQIMSAMLNRGTTRYTRQQISDRLDQLKVSGAISGDVTAFRTTRENLPDALRFVAHVLKEPSFPDTELEQLKRLIAAALESRKSDPGARAQEALGRHLAPYPRGDWRYVSTSAELIEDMNAVTAEQLRAFHREFLGASHGELAIVGDFDPKEISAVIEQEFGAWKSQRPYVRIETQYHEIAPIAETIAIPDKANAVFVARLLLKLRDDDPAYPEFPALILANYMIGGAPLSSRLAVRIRVKEGLSYGVGTSLSSNSLDPVSTFSASATAAPQNMTRLDAIFREELDRAIREGFTDEEIANAKTAVLQMYAQSRAQDDALAGSWVDKLYRGKTFAESAAYDEKLRAATKEEIQAAMKKHLDTSKISVVKAGSF